MKLYQRINPKILKLSMHPKEFCEKYSRHKIDEWGYKGQWAKLLAYCLDISTKSIELWGVAPTYEACPEKYMKELARIDKIKELERLAKAHGIDDESLSNL